MQARRDLQGVVWFLILTFGLTWMLWSILWIPGVAEKKGQVLILAACGMWGPGISALLVTRFVLRESWRTTTVDRLGRKRYYLWAWLLPSAATLVCTGLTVALGVADFDLDFSQLREMIAAQNTPPPIPLWLLVPAGLLAAVTVAPLLNTLFGVGEELGWRGFLLPRLIGAGLSQWSALLISGVIWGLWHAPMIIYGLNYPQHPYLGVLLMTVFTTLLGIIFGWLQLASGSVWVPALAHGALNAVAGVPLVLLSRFDSAIGGTLPSALGWIPLCVFIGWLAWSGRVPVRGKDTS